MGRLQVILGLALLATGCATRVPFTQGLRAKYVLTDDQLRNIQYYVSGPLTLRRDLAKGEVNITDGHRIRIVKDRRVEEIKVRPGTPGIAEIVAPHSLSVSFEKGNHLDFGRKHTDSDGNVSYQDRYQLYSEEWEYGSGQVTYAGKMYYAVDNSTSVHLTVDLREIKNFKKETRTLRGRRLSQE